MTPCPYLIIGQERTTNSLNPESYMPRMTTYDTVEVIPSVRVSQPRDIYLRATVGAFSYAHSHSNTDWLFNDTESDSLFSSEAV